MKTRLCVFAFIAELLCCVLFAQQPSQSTVTRATPDELLYITHVTVINTETGKETQDQTVLISGDRIMQVNDSNKLKVVPDAKVVDGAGKYVIPGLWDMHVHTWDYESTYPLYIANGVTGVRDMFGPEDASAFRRELAARVTLSPRFYLASPIMDGHPAVWPTSIEVTSTDQAKAVVDEQQRRGADFIKEYSRLSREAYFAIMAESARLGIPAAGHVPLRVSAWEASESRQASFEHLYGIGVACSSHEAELQPKVIAAAPGRDRLAVLVEAIHSYDGAKCSKLFHMLKENRNWQSPTLTVLQPKNWSDPQLSHDPRLQYFKKEYRDWLTGQNSPGLKNWTADDFNLEREQFDFSEKVIGAMYRAGVPILAGTDAGNPYCFPGFSLHDELALLVESGLTPLAALRAATHDAAVFMKSADRYGSIAKGKIADLVLLDADPLQDIHNTTKIREVFLNGKEFDRTTLDGILTTAKVTANAPR